LLARIALKVRKRKIISFRIYFLWRRLPIVDFFVADYIATDIQNSVFLFFIEPKASCSGTIFAPPLRFDIHIELADRIQRLFMKFSRMIKQLHFDPTHISIYQITYSIHRAEGFMFWHNSRPSAEVRHSQ